MVPKISISSPLSALQALAREIERDIGWAVHAGDYIRADNRRSDLLAVREAIAQKEKATTQCPVK